MLYFNQSIYIHSHIETPHGVRRLGGGGIWQFRPETMRAGGLRPRLLERLGPSLRPLGPVVRHRRRRRRGHQLLPARRRLTPRRPAPARILHGLNPGSPKYCGLEIVSGRHLPDDWQGNLITNDFRGHRVCRFVVSDDGAGYAAQREGRADQDQHIRPSGPIDVKMGPDGAIYIADWYNPIIQHGEVDFRDPRRDHTHGRIWRVTAKGRPLVPRPQLVDAPSEELLESPQGPRGLDAASGPARAQGTRCREVVPALAAWVKGLDAADPELEHQRLEALWTYQALDVVEPELLQSLLAARDPRVRAAAVRVVQFWHGRLSDPASLLARSVEDENPRVRLEAVRGLAHIPGLKSAELALRALDRPVDPFLDYALWLTARELQSSWGQRGSDGALEICEARIHIRRGLEGCGLNIEQHVLAVDEVQELGSVVLVSGHRGVEGGFGLRLQGVAVEHEALLRGEHLGKGLLDFETGAGLLRIHFSVAEIDGGGNLTDFAIVLLAVEPGKIDGELGHVCIAERRSGGHDHVAESDGVVGLISEAGELHLVLIGGHLLADRCEFRAVGDGDALEFGGGGESSGAAIDAEDLSGVCGVDAHEGVEFCARRVALFLELKHVLLQSGEDDLGAKHVGLGNLADGVLGHGHGERLSHEGGLAVVQAHLVSVAQKIDAGLANGGGDILPGLFHLGGGHLHVVAGEGDAQSALVLTLEGLLNHEHVLRLIQVPGLLERSAPVAILEHGIFAAAGGVNFGLCGGDLAGGGTDFGIVPKGDVDRLLRGDGGQGAGTVGKVRLAARRGHTGRYGKGQGKKA